ncbi:MAG: type II toxin-antitoxin system HipA family toxin [Rhodobacteraceae bacterium]|nr:type II toxin-antitoxin system HipA family toxin [Paracoccaceae bacterium]
MGRRSKSIPLAVYMNGRRVGTLTREATGATTFTYHDDWLGWENAFPVSLSLPLEPETQKGGRVVAVFDNLLPDNDALRRIVADRMGARGADPHSLLAAIGRDCVGAMQFVPEGDDPGDPFLIESDRIDALAIEHILRNLPQNPLGVDRSQAFRISVAGAQEKTALLRRDGAWHIPHAMTATTHILKTRMGRLQSGIDMTTSLENELLCLRLADAFGFEVNTAWIERFGDTEALVIERFDRRTSHGRLLRLPQEDFCQALGVPSWQKYEQEDSGPGMKDCLELLLGSTSSVEDRVTFFASQLFFWMIGATDGHAKNFSIFLGPGGFHMTPLYDILSAEPALASNQIRLQQMQLAMAVRGGKRYYRVDQIHPRNFWETGPKFGLGEALVERAFNMIAERGESVFDRVANDLPGDFPEDILTSILSAGKRRHAMICDYSASLRGA